MRRGEALALALSDDLRPGERIVVRDRSRAQTLDPADPAFGDREFVPEGSGATGPADTAVLIDADAVVPEPGLVDALRRPDREWDAWTGVVLSPDGATVATAGLGLTFLGVAVPLRMGLPAELLPETPFWTAALPAALVAVRRATVDGLPGLMATTDPGALALDLTLRLRAAGALTGVVPAARLRMAPGAAGPGGRATPSSRVRAVARSYPGAVLAVATPAAVVAAPTWLIRAAVRGDGRAGIEEIGAAVRAMGPAFRDRRVTAPTRTVGAATFADGLAANGRFGDGAARRLGRALSSVWWGSASLTLRHSRARSRRRAARAIQS